MVSEAQRSFSLDDYWAVESVSRIRHEFVHGAIYAMAGGSPRHNEVAANLQFALRRALDDTTCRPVGSDQRIRVSEAEYTYADVTVYCGRIEIAPSPPPDTATNPTLIVEVLSDSTRGYDHGDKLKMYQRLPSVQSVWLVEPDEPRITVWSRGPDGWSSTIHEDLSASLAVLGRTVAMTDVYARTVT